MRCPKCGFISFDLVKTCGKCGRDISEEAGLPRGTATNIESPLFLRFDAAKADPEAPEGVAGEMEFETEDAVMDMEEETSREIEFSLDDEPDTGKVATRTADIRLEETTPAEAAGEKGLGEIEEAPQEEDFTINLGEEGPAEQAGEEPTFDFAEIDISDLAPTEKETDNLLVAESVAEVVVAEEAPAAAPSARTRSAALEDLQFEGIDLKTQTISAQDAVPAGKISSTKTGTALDSFDVDLRDLFADEKE
ncbi:hypothetical protein BMS3Bbin14_01838 [bacterium BMS3Bbin14]|nr:hypothetical protein BMS3Bbin14_01838 [bacterium BMS3Bbin14]HDL98206.1 hypothetical protein [Desulfobacteraceae bacterium]